MSTRAISPHETLNCPKKEEFIGGLQRPDGLGSEPLGHGPLNWPMEGETRAMAFWCALPHRHHQAGPANAIGR